MKILGRLGGYFDSLGSPFGLILPLLGHFLGSFGLSWDVLGRLGASFSPKLGQVRPRCRKKPRFLDLPCEVGTKLGPKNQEKSMPKTTLF